MSQAELLKAKNDVRTTLLQGIAGALLLFGAFFTWRQLQIAQEGQLTARFTSAVEQLGSAQIDVRTGGIYALARMASDSTRDRISTYQIINTYIRVHSPRHGSPKTGTASSSSKAGLQEGADCNELKPAPDLEVRAPDVDAAILMLKHPFYKRLKIHLVLTEVDLRGADLRELYLEDAILFGSDLEDAILLDATLSRARLDTNGGRQCRVRLRGADLRNASFRGADLRGAVLDESYIAGADFRDSFLEGTTFKGAVADLNTRWPSAFDPTEAGVVIEE